nr:BatD family protein [uncultured Desulfuromonas sp.]
MVRRFLLTTLLLLLYVGNSWAEISASVSRNQLSINDSLVLEVVIAGDHDGDPDLSPLEKDFEIRSRSQSSQIQIVNGDMSRSTKWSLSLLPRRSGALTIPSICSGQDCSQPITVTVMPQSEQDQENADVLLEVESQPAERSIVQAQILYTVRLLLRQPVSQASLTPPEPQGVETLVQKLGDDQHSETYRNGWRYQVIERHYALFPQQSGKLHLPPLQFEAVLQGSRNPFDVQNRVIRQRSAALDMQITPPASTEHPWLPALGMRLEDDWQQNPPTLTVGEPATRTITLRGAGVTAAQLPEIAMAIPQGLKSYPDQPSREDVAGPTGLSGVLVQKVAVVPTHAGRFELPPISLYWWDVEQACWREETVPAISITVLPAERQTVAPLTAQTPPVVPPADATAGAQKEPAKTPATETSAPTPVHQGADPLWPWATAFCAMGWLITLLLWGKSSKKKRPVEPSASPSLPALPINTGKHQVLDAARQHDARKTYEALCRWGEQLDSSKKNGAEYWLRIDNNVLREEVTHLQRCLYASDGEAWQGDALLQALTDWIPVNTEKSTTPLPDFYPRRPS